jgi:hypothetical protein
MSFGKGNNSEKSTVDIRVFLPYNNPLLMSCLSNKFYSRNFRLHTFLFWFGYIAWKSGREIKQLSRVLPKFPSLF